MNRGRRTYIRVYHERRSPWERAATPVAQMLVRGNFRGPQACHPAVVSPASSVPPPAVLAEVVARFGERVVDVQHVGIEPEPRVASAGWYTLGACAMVLGLGLVAISLPGAPRADLAVTQAAESPAPRGSGAAGLGALMILLGVVPLVIAARSRTVPRDRYMIGEGPGVHLPVTLPAGATQAGVPLVRALERQIVLGLVPGMTGELHDGERTISVADLVAQGRSSYALPDGARGELALGAVRFTIQAVDRAAFTPERGHVDRLYLVSNAGALALLGGLLWLGEPPSGPLELEETEPKQRRERAVGEDDRAVGADHHERRWTLLREG